MSAVIKSLHKKQLYCLKKAYRISKEKEKMSRTTNALQRQGETWTREEVRTLKQIFRNTSNSEVAAVLQRTSKAVERKAAKLNLNKTKKYLRSIGRAV